MDTNQSNTPPQDFDLDKLAAEVESIQEPRKPPRRTALLLAGILGLIILLGAAAFVGMRLGLLGMLGVGSANGGMSGMAGPGGAQIASVSINIEPAPELPTIPPEVSGTFSRRDGNSLFIHQLGGGDMIVISGDGQSSGPEAEVVVTKETKIYRDTTDFPEPSRTGEEKTLRQTVEPVDSLDDIKPNSILTVWGEKRGERVIAQTILYIEMLTFAAPAR